MHQLDCWEWDVEAEGGRCPQTLIYVPLAARPPLLAQAAVI